MRKHLGRREREARKRVKRGKSNYAMSDRFGMVTLKLGRKKSSEVGFISNKTSLQLKKKFSGCVVDAER
jgi:hypothetical protein